MMTKTTTASLLMFISTVSAMTSVQAQECDYERNYDIELDAAQIRALDIDAGAGPIEILGQESGSIHLTARACASSERALDGVTLQYERRGDQWEVISKTEVKDGWFFGWGGDNYAYLEMTVIAPNGIALDVDDGSGALMISDWEGDVEIDDGSGSIELINIMGHVDIDDGSGSIQLTGGEGDMDIEDGSGDIDISSWAGSILVDDGSGDITVSEITGSVTVDDDGSGAINIADIDGDVWIEEDGSGDIHVYRITGNLNLGSTGSGELHFNDIEGDVSM